MFSPLGQTVLANPDGGSGGTNDGVEKFIPLVISKSKISLADLSRMLEAAEKGKQIVVGAASKQGFFVDITELQKVARYNRSLYLTIINGRLDASKKNNGQAAKAHAKRLNRHRIKVLQDIEFAKKFGKPSQVKILESMRFYIIREYLRWDPHGALAAD